MANWSLHALTRALGGDSRLAEQLLRRLPADDWGCDEAALIATLERQGLPRETWPQVDVEGLVFARACLAHHPGSLQRLDRELLPPVASALRKRASPDDVDEAMQVLRARLLLATPPEQPKLAKYSGRGALGAFLRIAAANVLSNLRPGVATVQADEELAAMPDAADVEARLSRGDQQRRFREVFRDAVQSLSSRERALLRLSLLDGLSIDEVAPMYGAHRATVARWLSAAKERLATVTRARLAVVLQLPDDEVERLLTSVQHGFELSLSRALRETQTPR